MFQISPPARNYKKPVKKTSNESEEVAVLSLAPFTPNPKIFFDNIAIGKTATRKLLINNPTNQDIELFVTKAFPPDLNVSFSWPSKYVEKNSEVVLELVWMPRCEGSYRQTFTLEDGLRIKRDIPVAFKSAAQSTKAKPNNKRMKPKSKSQQPRLLCTKIKSPVRDRTAGTLNKNRSVLPNITNLPSIIVSSYENLVTSVRNGKENNGYCVNPGLLLSDNNHRIPENRRETYIVTNDNADVISNSTALSNLGFEFNDSLETPETNPSAIKSNTIEAKLQAYSFNISPIVTPNSISNFAPRSCSTEERSMPNSFQHDNNFNFKTRLEYNNSNSSLNNISSGTYVKDCNLTSETYIKEGNNISSSTYVKDSSVGDIASLPLSPEPPSIPTNPPQFTDNFSGLNAKSIIQANMWGVGVKKKYLSAITEESYVNSTIDDYSDRLSLKRKSNTPFRTSAIKRSHSGGCNNNYNDSTNQSFSKSINRTSKISSGLNLKQFLNKDSSNIINTSRKVVETTISTTTIINDPFIFSITADPFMTSTVYFDYDWVDEQEKTFKKWLNALLTPPRELDSNADSHPLDVAKLWEECKRKEVALAPTKELLSQTYHINAKLKNLRNSALKLFRSKDISEVLMKVVDAVDKNKLMIRHDRNPYLDLGLQSEIMLILFSYNPLWLRIGLETIYNTSIPMASNSDLMGLSSFIRDHFFKNYYLLKKYKSIHNPKYVIDIKRFILKKFLILVYFLDQAKMQKLIGHDPCLFCKNAPIKESREVLLKFARETLAAVGDITKYLKYFNYVVRHEQTYINEFDYAVNALGVDLRDGVRLTKVMEIILLQNNLTKKLRVPAISRLQKLHNMKIVFDSLKQAGFEILNDIAPNDIVDGHKEKTLSFLWQIIYKFQAPLMIQSVSTIQTWWRSRAIMEKRRDLFAIRTQRNDAARKIISWYKRCKFVQKLRYYAKLLRIYLEFRERERAAVKIQAYIRMFLCRKRFMLIRKRIVGIQSYCRLWLIQNIYVKRRLAATTIQSYVRAFLARKHYLQLKYAVLLVEEKYLANKLMIAQQEQYRKLKSATLRIQEAVRANKLSKQVRTNYLELKSNVVLIQRRYRAGKIMEIERDSYITLKYSTIRIQQWIKAVFAMRKQRTYYTILKRSTLKVEQHYLANKAMRQEREKFVKLRTATVIIQRRYRAIVTKRQYRRLKQATILIQHQFRANKLMISMRNDYLILKTASVSIQRQFRAKLLMIKARTNYLKLRENSIIIQKYYRAKKQREYYILFKKSVVLIQQKFRAKNLMVFQRNLYLTRRTAIIRIQRQYRARLLMIEVRNNYRKLRQAIVTIQRKYRAKQLTKIQREKYLSIKVSAIIIQQQFRARKLMIFEQSRFLSTRMATVTIQRQFRAKLMMTEARNNYERIKRAALVIQRKYRAQILAQKLRHEYLIIKQSTILIQQKFRAKKLMMCQRNCYSLLKRITILIQRQFRAKLSMIEARNNYQRLKRAAIIIQRKYRAQILAQKLRREYQQIKQSTILIQQKYRAKKLMICNHNRYSCLKRITILIQRQFRAKLSMIEARNRYQRLRQTTILIQQKYRAKKLANKQHNEYLLIKRSVVLIQQQFRANKLMIIEQTRYLCLRTATITIQRQFRAKLLMIEARNNYLRLKRVAITIQQKYRAKLMGQKQQRLYLKTKQSVILLQQKYRAQKLMMLEHSRYQCLKTATILIQRQFRSNLLMIAARNSYQKLIEAVVIIQRKLRATRVAKEQRNGYLNYKKSIVLIQRQFRARKLMILARSNYIHLRMATICIQRQFRANMLMRKTRNDYLILQYSTKLIQQKYRANNLSKKLRNDYINLKETVTVVQRRYRGKLEMKKVQKTYLDLRDATIIIQRRFRAKQLMITHRNNYQELKQTAIMIQGKYRAKIVRENYLTLRNTVVMLQRRYRARKVMILEQNRYVLLRNAVINIQRRVRAKKLMLLEHEKYLRLKSATVFIQRQLKAKLLMIRARNNYQRVKQSAIIIQQRFRSNRLANFEKQKYEEMKSKSIIIQKWYRSKMLVKRNRNNYLQLRSATILIQQRYRAKIAMTRMRTDYLELRNSITKIQRYYRSYLVAKVERKLYLIKVASVTRIQKFIRGFLIRRKYSSLLTREAIQERKVRKLQDKCATKIQACWKGYRARSVEVPEMTKIRHKLKIANDKAVPENTLRVRRDNSIEFIISGHSTILQVIRPLSDLEYITRRCRGTCLMLGERLSDPLYSCIVSAGRSLPDMKVSNLAAGILINLCKYPATKKHTWLPQYIDQLLHVMLHWCDKEAPLFSSLCTLLWLFAHDDDHRQMMLDLPKFEEKLRKIKHSCDRRVKMVQLTGVKGQSFFAAYKHLRLPSLTPDWGLDYKPNVFTNSMYAYCCLMRKLKLDI